MITKVFEYNQHFVAMMNIINKARLNPPSKVHKHHIIPKCWFKKNNIQVDNSKDKFKEHYGLAQSDDMRLYKMEYMWYSRHNHKCRWEL